MRNRLVWFVVGLVLASCVSVAYTNSVQVTDCTSSSSYACIKLPGTSTGYALILTRAQAGNTTLYLPVTSGDLVTKQEVQQMIAVAIAAQPSPTPTPGASPTPTPMPTPTPSVGASATFVATDTTTQGSWKGVYGADGYNIVFDAVSDPVYAQTVIAGATTHLWLGATTDVRALQKASGTSRIASTWYSGTSFSFDVNLTDGQVHQMALYCLDWDSQGRAQRIDVTDSVSGALLNSQTVSGFKGGKYVVWNIKGRVKFTVTKTAGVNAVVSGLFFK